MGIKQEKKERLSRIRYANILFSESIRPQIVNHDKTLNNDELTAGRKTDQALHEKIASEYNDKNNESYRKVAFSDPWPIQNKSGNRVLRRGVTCRSATDLKP